MLTTDKNVGSAANGNGDNLETIVGIGPKTAEALAYVGVQRFADLAQATPEGLAKALFEQIGFRVSPKLIEAQDWIGQARAKVQPGADLPVDPQPAAAIATQPAEPVAGGNDPDGTDWQQHAGFSLFFDYVLDEEGKQNWQTRIWQTRLYHDETDAHEKFPGLVPGHWVNWILQHADLPTGVEVGRLEPQTASIIIQDIQVTLRAPPNSPTKKLVAEIHLVVTGATAERLTSANTPYQILLHTVDLTSAAIALIATERSQFQPSQLTYTHQLEFPIPPVGRYEVQAIFLGSAPAELLASYRGPIIRVTP